MILLKNDRDDNPIAIDTSMEIQLAKWSPSSGSILALAGYIN